MFGNKITQSDISLPVSACQAVLLGTPYFQLSVKLKSSRSRFSQFLHSTVAGKEGMEGTPALLKAITV
jgi:hypothetical protein